MKRHQLKTWPEYFEAIELGRKRFEVRIDDGRDFTRGDSVMLAEWDPHEGRYTGRCRMFLIGYVLRLQSPTAPRSVYADSPDPTPGTFELSHLIPDPGAWYIGNIPRVSIFGLDPFIPDHSAGGVAVRDESEHENAGRTFSLLVGVVAAVIFAVGALAGFAFAVGMAIGR